MHLITNARIYTFNAIQPVADAMLLCGNQIAAVGSTKDFTCLSTITEVTDLNQQTVLPGFTDAHIHLLHFAKSLSLINCETSTKKDCLEKIEQAVKNTPAGEWILGHGWNHHFWPKGIGTRQELDHIAPDHPVFLTNKSLHGAWVNSCALNHCGINVNTVVPDDGILGKDENGQLNGLLYESAVSLIGEKLPEFSTAKVKDILSKAQTDLFSRGVTCVHDFDRLDAFFVLQSLEHDHDLRLRVLKYLPVESIDDIIAAGFHVGFGSQYLTFGGIKLFADGALGTQTAAMLSPYEKSDNVGMLLIEPEEFQQIARKAAQRHLSLAVHAIGDRANQMVIEQFYKLRQWEQTNQVTGMRHRIEHLQTCQPADLARLAGLNVVASVQPIHLPSDITAADNSLGERARHTYSFRSMKNLSIPMVFGSDAPVELPDVLIGIHAAVNRTRRDHTPHGGWQPEEKLALTSAFESFTSSAHQLFPLNRAPLGKLAPGFLADLIVVDRDPFATPPNPIKDVQVMKTMVDGHWVWQK